MNMNEVPPIIDDARKPKNLLVWIVALTFLIYMTYKVGTYVWLFHNVKIGADQVLKEADGGFKKAKATINPEELRVWALAEIAKHQPVNNDIEGNGIPN